MNSARIRLPSILLTICFLVACLLVPAAHAAKRVALLVGNAAYTDAPLDNPPNDIKAVAKSLRELGFDVRALIDADQKTLLKAIREFGESARQAEVAFFYYSGHGVQSRGENFLVPVGARIQYESDIPDETVSANSVLRRIEEAAPRATVVILDACRDNPVAGRTRSLTKGLSRMEAPAGTLVAYATAPGTTAGDEGYYAQALAKYLKEPGLALEDIFQKVGADVAKRTHNKQLPRLDVGLYDKVFLSKPAATRVAVNEAPAAEEAAPAQRAAADPDAAERAEWALVQAAATREVVQGYLDGVRNGKWRGLFVKEAATMLKELAPTVEAKPAVKPVRKPAGKARQDADTVSTGGAAGPFAGEALPPDEPTTGKAQGAAAIFARNGTWGGQYYCAQGWTDLLIHIVAVNGNRVSGVFEFNFGNGMAVGAVEIAGNYDPASRSLEFIPGRWLNNPANFMAAGMRGTVSADGQSYNGRISHPSCGEFHVRRR